MISTCQSANVHNLNGLNIDNTNGAVCIIYGGLMDLREGHPRRHNYCASSKWMAVHIPMLGIIGVEIGFAR